MITAEYFIKNGLYRLKAIKRERGDIYDTIFLTLDYHTYAFKIDKSNLNKNNYVVYECQNADVEELENPQVIEAKLFDDGISEGVEFYNGDDKLFLTVYNSYYDEENYNGYIEYYPELLRNHSEASNESSNNKLNKWIDCTEDNYWNTINDIVCWKDHENIVYYAMKDNCPYGWNVLVRKGAKFMTPSNPFEKQ